MRKLFFLITSLLVFILATVPGCDSPSETKATSVTAPALVAPADNAENIPLTPNFTWTGDATKIEVATNTTFSTLEYSADVTGTSHTMTGHTLLNGTTYFWRAGKTASGTTYWSTEAWRFKTVN